MGSLSFDLPYTPHYLSSRLPVLQLTEHNHLTQTEMTIPYLVDDVLEVILDCVHEKTSEPTCESLLLLDDVAVSTHMLIVPSARS
jgi:hypothetical protein